MYYINQFANIVRVKKIDLSIEDFEDEKGFFMRCETAGYITYLPVNNEDNEAISTNFAASMLFNDPVQVKKIFKNTLSTPTTAEDIYIGYGV